jgi:cyclopropane fatty-acyl-phospholipid synthase-like methyltransferase
MSQQPHTWYENAPFLQRSLIKARPWICPWEPLLEAVPEGSHVFDIGCGTGLYLMMLAESGKIEKGLGRDINLPALEAARSAAQKRGHEGLNFEQASSVEDWPSEKFDVVSAIDLFHHIPPDLQKTFFEQAVARVRPGGRFVYKDMADAPFFSAALNRAHDLVLARQWISYVPLEDVKAWGEDCGLVLIQERCYTKMGYAHELLVFEKPYI